MDPKFQRAQALEGYPEDEMRIKEICFSLIVSRELDFSSQIIIFLFLEGNLEGEVRPLQ